MGSPRIVYTPRPDVTPETEFSALASVYRFMLDAVQRKEAAGPRQADDLEDEKERSKNDSLASTNYTG